jgi:hypothetical protein
VLRHQQQVSNVFGAHRASYCWATPKTISTLDDVALNLGLSNPVAGKALAFWAEGDYGGRRGTLWATQIDLSAPAATSGVATIRPTEGIGWLGVGRSVAARAAIATPASSATSAPRGR